MQSFVAWSTSNCEITCSTCLTITLVDVCDELIQGKGYNSVDAELRCDQSYYQYFATPSQRQIYNDARNGPRAANPKIIKTNIASASKMFPERA